jgi:hypothetical protein
MTSVEARGAKEHPEAVVGSSYCGSRLAATAATAAAGWKLPQQVDALCSIRYRQAALAGCQHSPLMQQLLFGSGHWTALTAAPANKMVQQDAGAMLLWLQPVEGIFVLHRSDSTLQITNRLTDMIKQMDNAVFDDNIQIARHSWSSYY